MKFAPQWALALLLAPAAVDGRSLRFTGEGRLQSDAENLNLNLNLNSGRGGLGHRLAGSGTEAEAASTTLEASVKRRLLNYLKGDQSNEGPGEVDVTTISKEVHNQMDVEEAMKRLDGKLPAEVTSLVKLTGGAGAEKSEKTGGQFDEESLQKARRILNEMIFTAWKELDDVIFECKEFQERNRGTFEQVMGDLARLGSQLSELGKKRVESSEGIMEADRLRKEAEIQIDKETQLFNQKRLVDDAEMTIRKNDLAVFDMILMMTKCPDSSAASLLQTKTNGTDVQTNSFKLCQVDDGGVEIHFDDPKLQAKVERVMTPDARRMLREALGQTVRKAKPQMAALLEFGFEQPTSAGNTTTAGFPTPAIETSPVSEEPNPAGQARKCTDGTPNCGLLHDLMSLEWGKFRDAFDELAKEMAEDQDRYDKIMSNMNDQLAVINSQRTKHMENLAETISAINADTEEMNTKDEQRRDLTAEYEKTMKIFSDKCTEILFTRICGVRKVRNNIMLDSTVSPPSKMSDCDFTDWYPRDGNCHAPSGLVIECDDTCPQPDPYACGGLEMMVRDVVVSPNEYGMICPPIMRQKKCKQIKCPVNCVESEWSGWSKCTKDCESGTTVRTRSILTKAKNGGMACDTVQEEEPCNTGSCDRDCSLDPWTDWAPCSMACGGGITQRFRKVLIPIRGEGKCPTPKSADRWGEKDCNTHACVGDEVCTAQQDLVLAIDSSGSLRESGFEVLRNFAANITDHYVDMYYGKEDMKVGVVQFGNGVLETMPDGTTTTAGALFIQGLTSDMQLVHNRVAELTWQRGFTNMAQAFQTADGMISQTGRADSQSAVMVITDGKYSMAFQTAEKASELKDKNVMIYMVAITESKGPELDYIKAWASQPWETNYVRIPGLLALEFNSEMFATEIITKFCPLAMSPSKQRTLEDEIQCIKIKEDGAPDRGCASMSMLPNPAGTPAVCAEMAREAGALAFMTGKAIEAGKCAILTLPMSDSLYDEWQNNRRNPQCPTGTFEPNPFWDIYACKAIRDPCGPGSGYGHLDLAHSTLAQNDLQDGGMIKLAGVGNLDGGPLDLEVTASGYEARNPARNGFSGQFGQINIRTCTQATFTFTFKDSGGSPVEMEEFEVTFFDIDRGQPNDKIETLSVSDYSEMVTSGAPLYTATEDGGSATVAATLRGVGADNPSDPMTLTPEQIRRSVAFKFVDKSSFQVQYEVTCNNQANSGRNFMFAFHSSLTPCNMR
jgi:uncharacterized protein YegL